MKYLRIIIVVLVIAVVGVGAYYLYLRFSPATNTPTDSQSSGSGQLDPSLSQDEVVDIVADGPIDYSTLDLKDTTESSVIVEGVLKSVESVGLMWNDIAYNYLINVTDSEDDTLLNRIWLTRPEYKAMANDAVAGDMVTVTITKSGVTIKKN